MWPWCRGDRQSWSGMSHTHTATQRQTQTRNQMTGIMHSNRLRVLWGPARSLHGRQEPRGVVGGGGVCRKGKIWWRVAGASHPDKRAICMSPGLVHSAAGKQLGQLSANKQSLLPTTACGMHQILMASLQPVGWERGGGGAGEGLNMDAAAAAMI